MRRAFLLLLLLTSCGRQMVPPHMVQVPRGDSPAKHVAIPGKLICLDAGHGGKDPGTQSPKHDAQEKRLTLATALLVRQHLERMGYTVMMTRDTDTFISLEERALIANRAGADLFVSIHYNAAPSRDAHGLEVFCFKAKKSGDRETESRQLAGQVLSKMLHYTKAESRGVKEANFAVLRRTRMPAILVEGGFLSNATELQKLRDARYGNQLAYGIAEGVHLHLAAAP